MSTFDPYAPPTAAAAPLLDPRYDRRRLGAIARYQKGVLLCLLAHIAMIPLMIAIPREVAWLVGLGSIVVSLASVTFVVLLAKAIHGVVGAILWGILSIIPCISLIALLVINSSATSELRRAGLRVGLLGVSLADLP